MLQFLCSIPYPKFTPYLFKFGRFEIRWYGLSYLAGFLIAYVWLIRMAKRGMLRMSVDSVTDLVTWVAVGVVVGGRLGWWLFYHRGLMQYWYEPIATWEGGMSFHGGLLGVAIVLLLFTRLKKIPFGNLADCAALVVPAGLFFGRIANFINGELYGKISHVPWSMVFPADPLQRPRHPSQLYEALLEGPILLGCLWAIKKWIHPREGVIAAMFLVLYGLFRFFIEFTREPDSQVGYLAWNWLTMGQVLSLVILLIGLTMLGRQKIFQTSR
jgi:phosphatidylglycerol---prolipoprotein diacylglyceryl transferase